VAHRTRKELFLSTVSRKAAGSAKETQGKKIATGRSSTLASLKVTELPFVSKEVSAS